MKGQKWTASATWQLLWPPLSISDHFWVGRIGNAVGCNSPSLPPFMGHSDRPKLSRDDANEQPLIPPDSSAHAGGICK